MDSLPRSQASPQKNIAQKLRAQPVQAEAPMLPQCRLGTLCTPCPSGAGGRTGPQSLKRASRSKGRKSQAGQQGCCHMPVCKHWLWPAKLGQHNFGRCAWEARETQNISCCQSASILIGWRSNNLLHELVPLRVVVQQPGDKPGTTRRPQSYMAVGQNPAPLVSIKIGGTWVFIRPEMEA